MEHLNQNVDFSDLPVEVRGRVALSEGVLHISNELRGNMALDDALSRLRSRLRQQNVLRWVWHTPQEFDRLYGNATRVRIEEVGDNEVKDFALKLLVKAHEMEASDIHITNHGHYAQIDFRCLGMLQAYERSLPGEFAARVSSVLYQTMGTQTGSSYTPSKRQDGRIANRDFLPEGVFSVRIHTEPIQSAAAKDGQGTFMALRLLYDATHATGTLDSRLAALGFLPEQRGIFERLSERSGLVVISGPTGHGKTTLLSHTLEAMAEQWPQRNHMSIEDPPEYPLRGVKQIMVSSRELESDDERDAAYTAAIAGAMRSDMDTGMIGEIRYRSAAQAAINAALTGHGIWTTIHASNALAIIPRFTELGIDRRSLCNPNVLSGLSYQRLLPRLCPRCKVRLVDLSEEEARKNLPMATIQRATRLADPGRIYVRGEGCPECSHRGLKGQSVAAEVIDLDATLLHYLREDQHTAAYRYWKEEQHGITHVAHALKLIEDGEVDPYLAEIRLGVNLDHDTASNLLAEKVL